MKDMVKRIKRKAQTGKMFAKTNMIKNCFAKYVKNSQNSIKNLILKWIKNFNRHLTKEDVFIANKHFKRCSTSHVIRKMEIKTAEYHYTPFQIAKIENTDIIC